MKIYWPQLSLGITAHTSTMWGKSTQEHCGVTGNILKYDSRFRSQIPTLSLFSLPDTMT